MNKIIRRLGPIAVAAALLLSCTKVTPVVLQPDPDPVTDPGPETPAPGEYLLPLIQTTDMHGYIVNMENDVIHFRMAYISDKVKDIRGDDKDRILLLDSGDIYQGVSVSNLLSGKPMYVSMHKMGYDAVALGNHEFDWGFESMVDADATLLDYDWHGESFVSPVPVVCANLYRNGSRVPNTRDYVIVEKSAVNADGGTTKVRIGVIGFAVNYAGSIIATQFDAKGYAIREDWAIANSIAAELESSGQCDATILLIHGAADYSARNLGQDSVIDLVLGGHSHRTISGWTSWGLPYLQGGRYCEHYASAQLRFSVDEEGKATFTSVDNMTIPTVDAIRDRHSSVGQNADDLDGEILAVSEDAVAETAQQQNDVIGYITVDATTKSIAGSGNRSAVLPNWMCDILRRIGEADVSFVNSGGVRTSLPLAGQRTRSITVANVYEIFPFSNTIYIYEITYAELLRLFEYAMTSAGDSLFSYMTGIDCYFTSDSQIYSLSKDGTVIYRQGVWTGSWASQTLKLAVSEYLATTQRDDYYTGMKNPLLEWNKSSRLLLNTQVDNENAIRVLRAEAEASGGLLSIDTAPHFILKP